MRFVLIILFMLFAMLQAHNASRSTGLASPTAAQAAFPPPPPPDPGT